MKEYSILFSGPMVRAILEGRKTQTRRVTKHNTDFLNYAKNQFVKNGEWYPTTPSGKVGLAPAIKCPYGKPGDILWVRETWQRDDDTDYIFYRADRQGWVENKDFKWRPSIFMPRAVSRITLEITGVRIERLNEISGPDCWAEGITHDPEKYGSVTHTYQELWESIKGKGSWSKNPWVWVIEFKRVA